MTHAIETDGLTRRYGRRRGVTELSFSVSEGEVFGFLGPNGAGKTTTIRLLLGAIRPTDGSVKVFGRDAWAESSAVHRQLAYLGGDPGFLGELTVREQLDYLAGLRGLGRGAWQRLAERLELDRNIQIRKLSRGNRQKVGVVSVFMGHEPLLVMDEPTSGLDPLMQREFLALVSEAKSEGRTVFLSSHNLQEVERGCDRVAVIREGRLMEIGPVQALLGQHWRSVNLVLSDVPEPGAFDLPDIQVVSETGQDVHLMARGDVPALLRQLSRLPLRDVSITTPDIEDVFLRYYTAPSQGERPATETPATEQGGRR